MKTMKLRKMSRQNSISANYHALAQEIIKKERAGHKIYIEAVTKTRTAEEVNQAIKAGAIIIAENKVQEAADKISKVIKGSSTRTHLIGHLQSNKTRKAVSIFDTIETVDSLKILKKIDTVAKEQNKNQEIYLQVNIGSDPNKYGFEPERALEIIGMIKDYNNVNLTGLMTILPLGLSKKSTRDMYLEMQKLYSKSHEIRSKIVNLSMGMSNDYQVAIECGANHVRIGTAIFGPRA